MLLHKSRLFQAFQTAVVMIKQAPMILLFAMTQYASGGSCGYPFIFYGPEIAFLDGTHRVISADFNQDGNADIAATEYEKIRVMIGDGDGTFPILQTITLDSFIRSLKLGDLNHDDIPDLIAAVGHPAQLVVILGDADGTFGLPIAYPSEGFYGHAAVGDVDGDGHQDILVTNQNELQVDFYLGNGDGTLQTPSAFPTEERPTSVEIGDINNDGIPDVGMIIHGQDGVQMLPGIGGGLFDEPTFFQTGSGAEQLLFADVNSDGADDLLVTNYTSNDMSVFLSQPDGTVSSEIRYSTGDRPRSIGVGDFDGDEAEDVVVTNSSGDSVSVLIGNTNGALDFHMQYGTGDSPRSSDQADFNNDGALDIIIASGRTLTLLLGDGTGSFYSETSPTGSYYKADLVAVGDLNADGFEDLVIPIGDSVGFIEVKLGTGGGEFRNGVRYDAITNTTNPTIIDLNEDGILDIVVINQYQKQIAFLQGIGDGSFAEPQALTTPLSIPHRIIFEDLNADGLADFVLADSEQVAVMLGTKTLSFVAGPIYPSGGRLEDIGIMDMNSDGIPDVVLVRQGGSTVAPGEVRVLLGDGDGEFSIVSFSQCGVRPSGLAIGDLNHDDIPDVAISNITDDTISLLFGNGDGTFQEQVPIESGYDPFDVIIDDFDIDGNLDLAVAAAQSNNISVRRGLGDGRFLPSESYGAGTKASALTTTDFDHDGDRDMVVLNFYGTNRSSISILINRTDPPPSCRVDLTQDETIDIFDVFAFLDGFSNGDLVSDFTDDCTLDIFDIFAFLDAFNTGCPQAI